MGSLSKILKDASGAPEDEKEQKERLQLLLLAARSKLQQYKAEMNERFMNPDAVRKSQIPGIRAIRYVEQYHVATQEALSTTVADHLDRAIDAFFSIGDEGTKDKDAVKGGIKSLIAGALDGFIGTTEAGETEEKVYVVVPENNAFVRADIACWKYHFDQAKFIHQHDTAIAYLLCKSVIDHKALSVDELIYLVSQARSTCTALSMEPLTKPQEMTEKEHALQAAAAALSARSLKDTQTESTVASKLEALTAAVASANKDPANKGSVFRWEIIWKQGADNKWAPELAQGTLLDSSMPMKSSAPDIAGIEAYIDELMRVWAKLQLAKNKEEAAPTAPVRTDK